jgi:hypothetical protein
MLTNHEPDRNIEDLTDAEIAPTSKKGSAISNERRAQSHRTVGKGAITVKYRLEATRVTADADAEMVVPHSLDLTGKELLCKRPHNLRRFRCWI